ncbi:hypothetical protein DESC_340031 [Desulfosarcina cetonica]|nr:hypothetical protein DESC_340031 [Desulfosarcina cetonica]
MHTFRLFSSNILKLLNESDSMNKTEDVRRHRYRRFRSPSNFLDTRANRLVDARPVRGNPLSTG